VASKFLVSKNEPNEKPTLWTGSAFFVQISETPALTPHLSWGHDLPVVFLPWLQVGKQREMSF
jgi:hypothetical protein